MRRSLGCPPDVVQVHEGDELDHFVACLCIRMFQRRLRITQDLGIEFIARGMWSISLDLGFPSISAGRIWLLRFRMRPNKKWCITLGLSQHSFPADSKKVVLLIEGHVRPGCATPPEALQLECGESTNLVPKGYVPTHHSCEGKALMVLRFSFFAPLLAMQITA